MKTIQVSKTCKKWFVFTLIILEQSSMNVSHAEHNQRMLSNILILVAVAFDNGTLFMSKITCLNSFVRYNIFTFWIIPASIGCNLDVVLGGKKASVTWDKSPWGCELQLPLTLILLFICFNHFSKIKEFIYDFFMLFLKTSWVHRITKNLRLTFFTCWTESQKNWNSFFAFFHSCLLFALMTYIWQCFIN